MKISALFLFILAFLHSFGQEPRPFPMEENAILWEISGNGAKKGSYLFGTMHLIEKEYFFFPESLEKIVAKSKRLTTELGDFSDQSGLMKLMLLEEGTLFDFFNEEQTDSLLEWAESALGMNEKLFRLSFSKMKPFVVSQMGMQKQLNGKTESYEMTLQKIAQENKLEMSGLETVEEQMSIFDGLTRKQQAAMVMETIRESENAMHFLREMERVYVAQNIDSLYAMITAEEGVISEEEDAFLNQRNERWIPKIEELIQSKRTFIAVGAGHLGGPNGIIRLLEQKGYTLTPVEL